MLCHLSQDLLSIPPAAAAAFRLVASEEPSLAALLATSDVVSLHAALTDATLHLINDDTAKHFKKGEGAGR